MEDNLTKRAILLGFIVLLGHLLTASGTLFGSDGARRFQVTQSLVHHAWVDIPMEDRAPIGQDGRHYAQYAIGHSLLMVPLYALGIQAARLFPSQKDELVEFCVSSANLLTTAALAGFLCLFAQTLGFPPGTSVALGLLYAFGTMAWQQSKDSFEHPQIAFYFTALFFWLHRFSVTRKPSALWIAGLFFGLAILTRYTSILAYGAVAVFLLGFLRQRDGLATGFYGLRYLFLFSASTLPFLGFDLWFNHARFGSILETGQQQIFGNLLFSFGTLPQALWSLLFGWEQGLFLFNPCLLLCIVGASSFYKQHRGLAVAVLTLTGLLLIFYSSTREILWGGGWAWGPRFFVDILPLLLLFAAPALEGLGRRTRGSFVHYLAGVLIVVSTVIQLESVLVNYNRSYAKKALGISHHSFRQHGPRESLIFMQAENIAEISAALRRGSPPLRRNVQTFTNLSEMNGALTFGTFQLWWVYALHLGVPKMGVWIYLLLSIGLIGWLSSSLWRSAPR